jgi:hypothetical protein
MVADLSARAAASQLAEREASAAPRADGLRDLAREPASLLRGAHRQMCKRSRPGAPLTH